MKNRFLYSFTLSCIVFLSILQGCQKNKSEETATTNLATDKLVQESSTELSSDCKNCGMPSKEYPKWNVKLLQNSSENYFCSPRCMFIKATEATSTIKITDSIFVVDYYNQKFIDARQAYFVINSDITGPMGHDFVPFADEKAAKEFQTEHKGKEIVRFSEVTGAVILKLGK